MKRTSWLSLLLICLVAASVWVVSRDSAGTDGAAGPRLAPNRGIDAARSETAVARFEPADALRDSPKAPAQDLQTPGQPTAEPASRPRGSLAVEFAAREPLDRLQVVVRGETREFQDSREAVADRLVFAELPVGRTRVELSTVLGKILSDAEVQVRAGEQTLVALDWPEPIRDRRRRTIRGEVLVPLELLHQLPQQGVQLELAPLLDSEEQAREATESRFLRVDRLAFGEGDVRRFAFEGLPQGGYELRLWPLLATKPVRLATEDVEVEVRFECGPLGRALLNFESIDGAVLRPRSVRARPVGESGVPAGVHVLWNERYLAYDLAALTGEYDLELEFEDRADATLRWVLEPGWSEHRLPAPAHGPIEVELLGEAQGVRVGDFSVTPEGAGRVLSLRLVRASPSAAAARLAITVDRTGPYRIRFEQAGRRRQSIVVRAEPSSNGAPQPSTVNWRLE